MKKILLSMCFILALTACTHQDQSDVSSIIIEGSPSDQEIEVVPTFNEPIYIDVDVENEMAYAIMKILYEQPEMGEPYILHYESHQATNTLLKSLVDKEADLAVMSLESALKLQTFGAPYKLVGILNFSPIYLVSKLDLKAIDEIKGNEVHVLNTDLQYVSTVLMGNGIHPKHEVKLTVWNDIDAMIDAYNFNRIQHVIIPEENYDEGMGNFIDFVALFQSIAPYTYGYPKGALVVRDSVGDIHPQLVETVEKKIEENISWIAESNEEAVSYADQLESKICRSAINYVKSSEVIEVLKLYFIKMNQFGLEIVVPNDDFYYQ